MTSRSSTSSDRHRASLDFSYADPGRASVVAEAVAREAGEIDGERTTATVERVDRTVSVTVEASDLVALRAGINTWCSLLEVAERVVDAPS